jgi:hypothetical protein
MKKEHLPSGFIIALTFTTIVITVSIVLLLYCRYNQRMLLVLLGMPTTQGLEPQ